MDFLIADTFTDSLARLTRDEQKAVKTTACDLQLNPANPGMRFHKLDRAKDKNFWSVRVSGDIRLIVHKTNESLLLCYVGHHDDAYRWGEQRKLQVHPRTGAAQFVKVRETFQEIRVPMYIAAEPAPTWKPPLFADISERDVLSYGVPEEWLDDVRQADEDSLFELAENLPREAAEALLDLAIGITPQPAQEPVAAVASSEDRQLSYWLTPRDSFEHPDAQRRFRVMTSREELERALEYPWEKWAVFRHPAQRELVERDFGGPARVAGSAGTGKTIVALHRAVYLARTNPHGTVLLTTFSDVLAKQLRRKLDRLDGNEPAVAGQIHVESIERVGRQLYADSFGGPAIASEANIRQFLCDASAKADAHRFSDHFLWTEWTEVVDAWQLKTWEEYRDVARLGRKTRIGEIQRQLLWSIFERVFVELEKRGLVTMPTVFGRVTDNLRSIRQAPFDFAIIDEAQDMGVPELKLLAALGASRPNALFFTGDLGQRIFRTPFSWKSLGVDIRGRSQTLRINYRTSHQIRSQADRLLPPDLSDIDGNVENRRGVVSVFDGVSPCIAGFDSQDEEVNAVSDWLTKLIKIGQAHEVAVFVRSHAELPRARAALEAAEIRAVELDGDTETQPGHASISTMHLAKGMEFRAVAVMACDDDVLPLQARIEAVTDDSDLEEVYNTESHLLYVACTRARDHLLVTGVTPTSEFLEDLRP